MRHREKTHQRKLNTLLKCAREFYSSSDLEFAEHLEILRIALLKDKEFKKYAATALNTSTSAVTFYCKNYLVN